MRQKLVAGNWKMNGSRASIQELLNGIKQGIGDVVAAEMALCAPYPYLADMQSQLEGSTISWGSQNLSHLESGAYTGEVSVSMLNDFGCKYAIVGHSERRALYGEDDTMVAKKYAAAQNGGLIPILCVGESLEERESDVTEEVVARQLDAVIAESGVESLANAVIAYEPVWAIGTGKTASPEQAQDVHAFIRGRIAAQNETIANGVQILYGGSMNAGNAENLMGQADIDGGLIGGASLKADDFLAIGRAAS